MVNCDVQLFSDDPRESYRYYIYTAAVKSNIGIDISRMGANLVFPITNAQNIGLSYPSNGGNQLLLYPRRDASGKEVQLHFLHLLKIFIVKTTVNLNSPQFPLGSFTLLNSIIPTDSLPTEGLQQQLGFHDISCNESQRVKNRINC